jgi:hypothetical protein
MSAAEIEHEGMLSDMETLRAEIKRLRELKTPASRQLVNITKGLLDVANAERDELLAALRRIAKRMEIDPANSFLADDMASIARAAIAKAEDRDLPTAEDVRGILKAERK